MRLLITLIAVAAFGLHILLGCCAHHAHAAAPGDCALTSSGSDDADHPCHSHGHDHEHSGPDSSDPPHSDDPGGDHSHNDCHESHCNFMAAGKTTITFDLLVAELPAVAAEAAIAQAATASYRWIGDTGDHSRLPVRLHLFYQVLLI